MSVRKLSSSSVIDPVQEAKIQLVQVRLGQRVDSRGTPIVRGLSRPQSSGFAALRADLALGLADANAGHVGPIDGAEIKARGRATLAIDDQPQ